MPSKLIDEAFVRALRRYRFRCLMQTRRDVLPLRVSEVLGKTVEAKCTL